MIQLSEGAGQVIASDVTTVFQMTDQTLLSNVRLAASVLEGTEKSGLHPRTKQKLLETVSQSFDMMLQGRKSMVDAHGQMIVIQRQSSIAEVGYGCWGAPGTSFTSAESTHAPEEARRSPVEGI